MVVLKALLSVVVMLRESLTISGLSALSLIFMCLTLPAILAMVGISLEDASIVPVESLDKDNIENVPIEIVLSV